MSTARGFIVTGSSRGLGAALTGALTDAAEDVVAVQRKATASGTDSHLRTFACDFSDVADVDRLAEKLATEVAPAFERLVFINNAGVIGPIRKIGELGETSALVDHVTVNYVAPALIVDRLVAALPRDATLDVVNVSSGAAERPIPGWSLYCSSKKAFKSYLDVLDAETDRVTVTHVDPGVMDTGMQETIREADVSDFPGVEQFRGFQTDGRLRSVEDVARSILEGYLRS